MDEYPCPDGPLPRRCPWTRCKWHMAIDVNPDTGTLRHRGHLLAQKATEAEYIEFERVVLDWLEREPWHCAHDIVAKMGPLTLEAVSRYFDLTRERIRQIESLGLLKLRARLPDHSFRSLGDYLGIPDERVRAIGKEARARSSIMGTRANKRAKIAGVRKSA